VTDRTSPPLRGEFHSSTLFIACWFCVALPAASTAQGPGSDSLAQRAAVLYAEGSYRDVVKALGTIPADTLSASGAFYLGSSYAALGDIRNASRHLRSAVARAPFHAGYRLQFARVLAQAGILQDARAQYEILVAGDRPFLPALTSYGTFLFDDADFAGAAAIFHRSLAENPRDYLASYYLGACLDRLDEPDSAVIYLAASISLNSDYAPAGGLLASLYYARKDYDQSLLLYTRLCKQRPRNAEYWYKAGLCNERLGNEYRAVDLFRRAATLDTSEALYDAHIGQIFFGLSRLDSSVAAYRRAVSLDAANSVLFLNLGLALARMDSARQAIDAFQRSAAAHQVEKAAVPHTQIGAILYNAKDYRKARNAYAKALQLDPSNMEALFFIGFTHEQTGAIPQARNAFEKYLKAAAGDPALRKRIAQVQERLSKITRVY